MKSKEILPEDERGVPIDYALVLKEKTTAIGAWALDMIDRQNKALLAAENEIQEDKESFLKTIQNREEEIHKHISRVQDLEKEIKKYKKLAKDNVPELVKMLKNRKI